MAKMEKMSVNPFVHRLEFKTSDYIKIFIGSITLLPLRFVSTLILFILASMMAKFANFLLEKWKLDKEEEVKWRNILKQPSRCTLRLMFFIAGFHKIKVTDKSFKKNDSEARILVLAPHTSPFDIIAGLALDVPSVVARHDAVDIPFFGNMIKLTDPVFVQRDSQSSRQNVMNSVLEKIKYNRIVFFPEGTCTNRNVLAQFKLGAFKTGLPVQPIALKYDQFEGPDTLSWTWCGPSAYKLIWLTFTRWQTGFEIVKLPVYYPSQKEIADPELYAKNVSLILSKELKIPTSHYSYDDVKFMKYEVPSSPTCLKFLKVCQKFAAEVQHDPHMKQLNNGVVNGTNNNNLQPKNKFFYNEFVIKMMSDTLEKIQCNEINTIESKSDLIHLLGLKNYPQLYESSTLEELYQCLLVASSKPNTIHLSIIMNLCDFRGHKIWNRIKTSFHLLLKNESNNHQLSKDALKVLLWFTLGVDPIYNEVYIKEPITFENLQHNLAKNYGRAMDENLSQFLINEQSTNSETLIYR